MLLLSIFIVLGLLIASLCVIIVWLVKTIKKNMEVQGKVTAELLDNQAATHHQDLIHMRAKIFAALQQIHEKEKVIDDLTVSIELLNTELQRAEEINMLEHKIKGVPPQR